MDNKVKIAIGCAVAAVLSGLLVVIVAGVVLYYMKSSSCSTTNRNYNSNSNRNSRSDSSPNSNGNNNDNTDANDNESSSNSSSSSSSQSDDQRHRLLYAATVTGDAEVIQRVSKKIGILKDDHTPTETNIEFMTQHVGWVLRNSDFVQSLSTPEKARAYVDKHIND